MSSGEEEEKEQSPGWRSTEKDHRKAYEIWRENRTISSVVDGLNYNYRTVKAWQDKNYKCRFGCLWHGWDELLQMENEVVKKKVENFFANPVDPSDPKANMTFQRDVEIKVRHHRLAIVEMVRSDLERLTHLEMLYGMVFFRMTGIKLETGVICDARGISLTFDELYSKMPEVKSFEGGLSSLSKLIEMIDKVRLRAGLIQADGTTKHVEEVKKEEEERVAGRPDDLTLEDLRDFKALLENTTPEKRAALKALMDSEVRTLNASSF